jgi:cation diffusion facilitator CzcD-associated flavoprotein CzcO
MTEHVDVVIIGAGLSGVGAAYRLQQQCPWASFIVLESRHAIGGTWDLFRYPGIRSDSDMFTLGYPFRPWDGEQAIAGGDNIRSYIADTAHEAGIDERIRFGHRVTGLQWSSGDARWQVTAHRVDSGDTVELTCGFVVSCTGYYRYDRGHTPEFAGQQRFAGTVVHPQFWPDDLDVSGKGVVVIGSGATAITLVPALAQTAGHVTMLQRSPTWVVGRPTRSSTAQRLRRWLPQRVADRVVRWLNVVTSQGSYFGARRFPKVARRLLLASLERDLPAGFAIDPHFTPRYDPWEQRLCVATDGDLFAAIANGSASVVTDSVATFTETGIELVSGEVLDADVVVTATGLELLFMGGVSVTVDDVAVDPSQCLTYRGMMLEGVPNLAVAFGYANASWTLKADLTSRFVADLVNYLNDEGLASCTPVNGGVAAVPESIMGLASGYVERAAGILPHQGAQAPWRVQHSYRADRRAVLGHRFDGNEHFVFAPR